MSHYTILCVDDEENILSALERVFLEEDDYEILTAMDGERGLEVIGEREVDLIISDQRMPGMSGTDFLKKVRERFPDTIRIVLSGYADFDTVTKAINEGEIFRLIQKPWDETELLTVVRDALERHDLMRENKRLQEEIEKQNDKLKRLNHQLEERVKERTAELEMRNQALLLSQEIFQSLPNPIMGVSNDGMIAMMNQRAQELFQNGNHLVIGENIAEVLSEDAGRMINTVLRDNREQTMVASQLNGGSFSLRCLPLQGVFAMKGVILEVSPIENKS